MRKVVMFAMMLSLLASACSKQSAADKVAAKEAEKYQLTAEEMVQAENSAKNFFGKQYPSTNGLKSGMFTSCRPSDSNFNGMVSCMGYLPNQQYDIMVQTVMYCNYKVGSVLGCSNQDNQAMIATSTSSVIIFMSALFIGWVLRGYADPLIDKYKAWRKSSKQS